MTIGFDDITRRRVAVANTRPHMDIDEFRALLDVAQEDLDAIKTPKQWDETIAVFVLILHERLPSAETAALAIAAFMRGVLEGRGCALPWTTSESGSLPGARLT